MKISGTRRLIVSVLLIFILFYSCKKETFIVLEGKILVSNTNPVEVSNYKLNFFQAGNPGIPFPATVLSAEGSATTDNNGNYSTRFKPGKSTFVFFQGTNSHPINMTGEANGNFPGFHVSNLTANGGIIYLYKKIDNVSLNIATGTNAISPADSIFISYNSTSGPAEKILSGISVPAATTSFLLGNIANVTLGRFDYWQKVYQNDVLIKLKKPGVTYPQFSSASFGDYIPPGDEPARQLSFYFY